LAAVHRFEELEVFQRAYKVSLDIHRFTLTMPQVEQRILADQLRRASKSICANLAEGFGKQGLSKTEFRRFVLMSIGSADEMRVWLRYCLDLEYVDSQKWERWRDEYEEIAKMLQGLGKSLKQG
jgi:four helix bundle protein